MTVVTFVTIFVLTGHYVARHNCIRQLDLQFEAGSSNHKYFVAFLDYISF